MKQDLQYLHRQFPAMLIVYSNINERRRWRADHPGKLNHARKWLDLDAVTTDKSSSSVLFPCLCSVCSVLLYHLIFFISYY
ncbi:unnamed protein product [Arctogadus glacialis]